MNKQSARSESREADQEETASRERSTASSPAGARSTAGRLQTGTTAVSGPADRQSQPGERIDTDRKGTDNRRGGYVGYDAGPNREGLSARYGMEIACGEARTLQRLESEFGTDRVERWAAEGMRVATMGKPRDMAAFRERQAERPDEVPIDVERRNAASARRNAAHNRESGAAGDTRVPEAVRRVVSSPGRSLDETVQREMEEKMGGEFGDVRVHTGPRAAAAAEAINARAFTVGSHVAFNEGEYRPDTDEGKRVLAHELTHVRQQSRTLQARIQRQSPGNGDSGDESGSGGGTLPDVDENWLPDGWEEETYDVSGKSCEELRQNILKAEVSCDDEHNVPGNRAAATCFGVRCQLSDVLFTIPRPNQNISTQEVEGENKVEVSVDDVTIADYDVSISFTRRVIMPRWDGKEDADESLRESWLTFLKALQNHERAHVQLAEKRYEKIEKTLRQHVQSVPDDVGDAVRQELDGMKVEKDEDTPTTKKVTSALRKQMSKLSDGVGSKKLEAYVEKERKKQIDELAEAQSNLHDRIGEKESLECD